MITNAVTLEQGVTVTQLKGQIYLVAADGSRKLLAEGDVLPKGAVIMSPDGASFMGGGQSFNVQPASEQSEPAEEGDVPQLAQNGAAGTPDDINALQQAILGGADPTQAFEASAAGGAPAAGGGGIGGVAGASGNGGFVTIDRTGDATIAEATFDTTYNANGEPPLGAVGEDEVFDLTPPIISVVAPDNTNDTTPTLTGITDAPIGSTVTLLVTDANGNQQTLTAIVAPSGTFTVDVVTPLAEGSYTVTATVTDLAENIGTATDDGSVDIDYSVESLNDSYEVNEDGSVSLALLANDKAPDGGLVIQSINGVALTGGAQSISVTNGTVVITADGSISFVPNKDFNGDISFEYVANDVDGDTDSATVNITVTPVNDNFTDASEEISVAEDSGATLGSVLTGTNSVDGQVTVQSFSIAGQAGPFTLGQAVSITGVGSFTLNANGNYSFTPVADYNGPVPVITYVLTDGSDPTVTSTLTINVTPADDNFTDASEEISVTEDSGATLGSVLTGTNSVDGQVTVQSFSIAGQAGPFTLGQAVSITGVGSFTLNANGNYSFTPVADYNGPVPVITYVLTDGSDPTVTSTLTINVTPADDNFTDASEEISVAEDSGATLGSVLTGTNSVDGQVTVQSFSIAGQAGPFTLGQAVSITGVGSFTLNANGNYSFTPVADYNGPVPVITYVLTDGSDPTVTSTLTINVTPADDNFTDASEEISVAEDSGATLGSVLTGTNSVDGQVTVQSFSIAGQAGPFTLGQAVSITGVGSFTLNANGNYSFTPVADYNGPVPVITYVLTDGSDPTVTSTLTINVTPADDNFTDASEEISVAEDSGATLGSVLTGTNSVDGQVTVQSFSIAGQAGPFTLGQGVSITGVGSFTLNANGNYSFTPVADYNGPVPVITYVLTDGSDPTVTSTLTINVTPADDNFTDASEEISVAEDSGATLGSVLTGTNSVDGQVTVQSFSIAGQAGPFTLGQGVSITGVGSFTLNANGNYSFTPVADYNGPVPVITYVLTDGSDPTVTSTLTINVTPADDNFTDASEEISVAEDSGATLGSVLTGTNSVDGQVTVQSFSIAGQAGPFTLGQGVSITGVGSFTLNANGNYSFTPVADYNGPVPVITYVLTDGSDPTVTSTLTINVTPADDNFTDASEEISVAEDSGATLGSVLTGTNSVDGQVTVQSFSIAGQAGPFTLGQGVSITGVGSFTLNANGNYSFTPVADYNGPVPVITYVLTDGSDPTVTSTLTINVTPADDNFTDASEEISVAEDSGATLGSVLTGTNSVDGQVTVQSFSIAGQAGPFTLGQGVSITGVGSFTLNANGNYSFTPVADYNGPVPVITYVLTDGSDPTVTSTLTINVTPADDNFTDASEEISVAEDSGATLGSVLTGTNSVDGQVTVQSFSIAGQAGPFTLGQAVSITGVGSFTLNANGNYSFTPVADYNGPVPVITYVLTDGSDPTVTSTLTISVTPVDDPVTLVGLNGTEKTVDEANLATGTQPNNAALTQSGSFSFSTLDGLATLTVAGTTFTLVQLQTLSTSSPATITTAYGTLTLTGFSGDASGGTVSYSYTLNTKVDNDNVTGASGTGYLDSISVTVKDIDNNSANDTLDINIVDDVIVLNEGDLNGTNVIGTYVGTGLLDTSGADLSYSADLSANVTGWNGTSIIFADSGITSSGNTLFYFVDPLRPEILYAYTDKGSTPDAYDASNPNQQLVFTLTAEPNGDSYTMQIYKSIDSLSEVVIAGLNGGEGGNSPAVYVGYNVATSQFDIDNDLSDLAYDLAFTLTSRNANSSAGTVNGNTGGFGVNNAFVDSGEVFIIDYAKDVASATITFSGAALVQFKAYDKNGQLLGEGNIASGGEISNLGAISHIELTTTGVGNDFRFQFNGTSAQEIVTSTQGTSLNFDVTVKDSDGDTANGNFDVNLAAPGGIPLAPLALTVNSIARLQEADLLTNGLDSDSQALTFKAGSDAIGMFQFGDVSSIQVSGINANISWELNEFGQLIGTTMGREVIRLTLDWDRINAGEQGNVTVKAELLTTLPHSINIDNLTVSGIKVIGVTGTGQSAVSNVTVNVADDVPNANNDTGSVDVIVDSFIVSGVEANWTSWSDGTSVIRFDGTNNPNGGGTDNDDGLDQIRWGNPTNTYKSGYGFIDNDSALNGQFDLNQDIILGTFTHYNFPISSDGAITKATMDVTFSVTDAFGVVTPVTLKVNFDHNETPNSDDPEASKDFIKVGSTNVTFEYQGAVYTLQVIGFRVPGTDHVVTEIRTAENAASSYELVVRIVAGNGYELPSTEGNVLDNDVIGADDDLTIIGAAEGDQTDSGTVGNVETIINGQYGTLIISAHGSYTYVVTANASEVPANATETFTYTVQDADGDKSSALLTINVNTVNANASKAAQDQSIAPEDTAVIGNVLENDGNENTSVTNFTVGNDTTQHIAGSKVSLAEGELTINADGSYTFTPEANWNGQVPVITYTTNTRADA